jgi:hypothetical protein
MQFSGDLDLAKIPRYSKLEVAKLQLDRAVRLFLDEADYVCAVTPAGAAEEILGKLLERQRKKNALGSVVEACVAYGREVHEEEWAAKDFRDMANQIRNGLKHYSDGDDIDVPRDAAEEMIDRAIENLLSLSLSPSEHVQRFLKWKTECSAM